LITLTIKDILSHETKKEESKKDEAKETMIIEREVKGWMSTIETVQQLLIEKNTAHDFIHKALFIAKNIIRAEALCKLVTSFDMQVKLYHSKIEKQDKEKILSDFEENKLDALIIIDSLREGYDHPQISVTAVCTNITSEVKLYQFIGRGVRKYPSARNDTEAHTVYCESNYTKFSDLLERILKEELILPLGQM